MSRSDRYWWRDKAARKRDHAERLIEKAVKLRAEANGLEHMADTDQRMERLKDRHPDETAETQRLLEVIDAALVRTEP